MELTTRPDKTEDGFTIVYDPNEVPEFASEADEATYWDTHTWSEDLLEQARARPAIPSRLRPVTAPRCSRVRLHSASRRTRPSG